jgi:hypothetical protein
MASLVCIHFFLVFDFLGFWSICLLQELCNIILSDLQYLPHIYFYIPLSVLDSGFSDLMVFFLTSFFC